MYDSMLFYQTLFYSSTLIPGATMLRTSLRLLALPPPTSGPTRPSLPFRWHSQMRKEVKKSKPVSKGYFKVVSKVKNAKYMVGSGRGKSRVE